MSDPAVPPEGGRDAYTRERMQRIARLIDEELPDRWGFALFAFPLGEEHGRLNYVGKGDREDIKKMILTWIVERGGKIEGHG